jgi:hypothetical protein
MDVRVISNEVRGVSVMLVAGVAARVSLAGGGVAMTASVFGIGVAIGDGTATVIG